LAFLVLYPGSRGLSAVLSDNGLGVVVYNTQIGLIETILGKEYPDTLTSMNNIGLKLSDQGKYKQTEEMHRQALRLSETVLGKEHPSKAGTI
jgi:hypothetical protein